MENTIPIILNGLPMSGKTHFLRRLIPTLNYPVFVLDVHSEYEGLREINLGEFFSLEFKEYNRKLRLIPNSNVDVSKTEADSIFRHLIMFQKQLSDWIIVVEEGHRFQDSPFLRSLMAEARKHIRKLIVVSHQPEPFKGLGLIYTTRLSRENQNSVIFDASLKETPLSDSHQLNSTKNKT